MFNELIIVKTDVNIVSRCVSDLHARQLQVEKHLKITSTEDQDEGTPYSELVIPLSNTESDIHENDTTNTTMKMDNNNNLINLESPNDGVSLNKAQKSINNRLSTIERGLQVVKKLADVFGQT